MSNIIIEPSPGSNFDRVAIEAQSMATENKNVEFNFNGIICIVSPATNLTNLLRDYQNSFLMNWKQIGPVCEEYSEEVKKELHKKNVEREELMESEQLESIKKLKKIKQDLATRKGTEVFNATSPEKLKEWEIHNTDSYGARIVEYAKDWGILMQVELGMGHNFIDIVEKTSSEADYDGITGFMYGAAVQILSDCWIHGAEVRKWNNKRYGKKDEADDDGTVINPAIISI